MNAVVKKKSEKDLTRFGRVLSSSSNEIYMFSSETLRFTQVNAGACKNLGYSIDDLREMTPLDLKPEHNLETFQKLIEALIEKKKSIKLKEIQNSKRCILLMRYLMRKIGKNF